MLLNSDNYHSNSNIYLCFYLLIYLLTLPLRPHRSVSTLQTSSPRRRPSHWGSVCRDAQQGRLETWNGTHRWLGELDFLSRK